MKKLLLLLMLTFLLTGCSKLDGITDHIPFLNKEKESEETAVNNNNSEQTNDQDTDDSTEELPWTLEAAFFNDIKVVDGRNIIQNPTNTVSLVNKSFGLPDGYAPEDLIRPEVQFSFGNQDIEKSYMRKEAANSLADMFNAAKKDGVILYAVSGYRSYDRQTVLYDAEIEKVGQKKAEEAVAYPGNSEHQTGLAMDISAKSVDFLLTEDFEATKEGKWLKDNAHLYGYILRYPKGKEDITKYKFEPWHFRYVGEKSANDIYENGWTLEEYFDQVRKI
ncbi:D-alanyl-D-alanine carboxypeptidase family protein [Niallia taxi]|uniref:D-alanyl-D-alanine carboxypeptidase family protein n=1 Tax=Niallia taxi TaxID=2499688 RepID=A0A437KEK2_9BACI|nr:M15 family metallopeptidase [Niallia taxi]MCM3215656.1 M15 family metallopeptidase [Niallia taxi]MDK8641713.1 M15 family metallopeptidase [Niallia taxi]MED4038572.1 M15 family metallopeptidase [Niallia taxi]MED4057392.1 M15 family metallopeptidase [Niallia taxi]MED4117450.1 M15 family metallopeptidase [Niallia taxi]